MKSFFVNVLLYLFLILVFGILSCFFLSGVVAYLLPFNLTILVLLYLVKRRDDHLIRIFLIFKKILMVNVLLLFIILSAHIINMCKIYSMLYDIERYCNKEGKYPENINDLIPKYIEKTPKLSLIDTSTKIEYMRINDHEFRICRVYGFKFSFFKSTECYNSGDNKWTSPD